MTSPSRVASCVATALSWSLAAALPAQDILLEKGSSREAATGEEAKAAPRSGRDHWSRWNYPAADELPADAKLHIVVPGDTLWAIAEAELGDPYLWPQIWEVNRYILDPHWIYPGDPVVIPQPLLISEELPEVEAPIDLSGLPSPVPVATRHDVYCAPYIVAKSVEPRKSKRKGKDAKAGLSLEPDFDQARARLFVEPPAGADRPWIGFASPGDPGDSKSARSAKGESDRARKDKKSRKSKKARQPELSPFEELLASAPQIVSAEALGRVTLAELDVVHINRGERDGVKAGDEFLAVRSRREVFHPETGDLVGVAMQMVGVLRVLCTQERFSTAVVASSCEPLALGDLVRPFEPIPIPLASEFAPTPQACDKPAADKPTGHVLYTKGDKVAVGEEDLINVSLGGNAGIVPGDFLTLYRPNAVDSNLPNQVLGDAVVLFVEPTTATAKVMASNIDSHVGDRVRLR